MDTRTFEVHRGEAAVEAALDKGRPLVMLSEEEAGVIEACANRKERRRKARELGLFGRKPISREE